MTARQQEALDFIRAKQRIVTVGPSHRELAEHMGIAANAAQQKVNFLRKSGMLAKANGHGLVLTSSAIDSNPRKPIPRPSGRP
jgi:DNA-binding transcriptional regulator YhcF (GntR family)